MQRGVILALMVAGTAAVWVMGLPNPLPVAISCAMVVLAYALGASHEQPPAQSTLTAAAIAAEVKERLLDSSPGTADYVKLAEQISGIKATLAAMSRALALVLTLVSGGSVAKSAADLCEKQLLQELSRQQGG